MVAVHNLLHGDALLACADGDGNAVLIASADEQALASLQTQIAHIDVGRHIDASQMTDMHRSVCVRQSGRNGCSLEFLFHMICVLFRAKVRLFFHIKEKKKKKKNQNRARQQVLAIPLRRSPNAPIGPMTCRSPPCRFPPAAVPGGSPPVPSLSVPSRRRARRFSAGPLSASVSSCRRARRFSAGPLPALHATKKALRDYSRRASSKKTAATYSPTGVQYHRR